MAAVARHGLLRGRRGY